MATAEFAMEPALQLPQLGAAAQQQERPETPSSAMQRTYCDLRSKVLARVDLAGARELQGRLEESAVAVRQNYKEILLVLKELELNRIDLQSMAQWLSSTRRSWQRGHEGLESLQPRELAELLDKEEQHFASEMAEADRQIALVSTQAAQLRAARDALEQSLVEHRRSQLISAKALEGLVPRGRDGKPRWSARGEGGAPMSARAPRGNR
eukprot:TRINITY_DN72657_c0_g1_i1.p2 TRINITY_DN72657_c0_g1~~TRINITY_DN72657_c0_g1_i1.p2  ORF type:complete len:209 (+),score=64.58 TRINITY_DN72657_c0_g1_i1:175-801(+)